MGHIFFITPSSPGSLDRLSQWTFRWLLEHGDLAEDSTMYTCNSIEDATNLLESALIIGQSPALIILDHADRPCEQNRGSWNSFPTTCRSPNATRTTTGYASP